MPRSSPPACARRRRRPARSRSASAWRLALGGLAVAPPGLGGFQGGLLPRLRVSCRGRLAGALAALLGGPRGGGLDGTLPPSLRASRRQALPDGLAVRLRVPAGRRPPRLPAALLGRPPGRGRERRLPPLLWRPRGRGLARPLAALLRRQLGCALQGGFPASLRSLGRRRFPRRLAPPPPVLVRVRHHHLLAGSALAPQPLEHLRQPRLPRLGELRLERGCDAPLGRQLGLGLHAG